MTINDNNIPAQENEHNEHNSPQFWPDNREERDAELPEQSSVYRVAGFWTRLLAFSIDMLVVAALNSIIWNALSLNTSTTGLPYKLLHVNSLFLGITGAAYFIIMTRYYQQTLGKMILGIKVVQRSNKPLSWITVIFRELVARSLSQLMGLYLGYIVCWFNREKRCAHDYLSDTWVVYEKSTYENHSIVVEG